MKEQDNIVKTEDDSVETSQEKCASGVIPQPISIASVVLPPWEEHLEQEQK